MSRVYHGSGLYFEAPETWRLKYKFAGREKMVTLGRGLTKVDAEVAACRAKGALARGIDPGVMRRAEDALLVDDNIHLTRVKMAKVYLALFADKREALEFLRE
jgi:hypothetical protein